MSTESELTRVHGEFIAGPFDGLPAMLNGLYEGQVVVLVCDYSGRYSHVPPDSLSKFFKPTPDGKSLHFPHPDDCRDSD